MVLPRWMPVEIKGLKGLWLKTRDASTLQVHFCTKLFINSNTGRTAAPDLITLTFFHQHKQVFIVHSIFVCINSSTEGLKVKVHVHGAACLLYCTSFHSGPPSKLGNVFY